MQLMRTNYVPKHSRDHADSHNIIGIDRMGVEFIGNKLIHSQTYIQTLNFICQLNVVPCGLRGCKNWPAPFPGRMSYKATKPGLVSVLYLSMRYNYGIVVY